MEVYSHRKRLRSKPEVPVEGAVKMTTASLYHYGVDPFRVFLQDLWTLTISESANKIRKACTFSVQESVSSYAFTNIVLKLIYRRMACTLERNYEK